MAKQQASNREAFPDRKAVERGHPSKA